MSSVGGSSSASSSIKMEGTEKTGPGSGVGGSSGSSPMKRGGDDKTGPGERKKRKSYWDDSPPAAEVGDNEANGQLQIGQLTARKYNEEAVTVRVIARALKTTKSSGFRFICNVIDKSGQIGFIGFREDASRMNGILKMNGIYEIQNFSIKPQKKEYEKYTGNSLQGWIEEGTTALQKSEDDKIPSVPLNLVSISDASKSAEGSHVDVLGVVVADEGKKTLNRDIVILDKTGEIVATLWDIAADEFKLPVHSIVCIRSGSVSYYHGVDDPNINCNFDLWVDPPIPDAEELRKWFAEKLAKKQQRKQEKR